MGNETDAALRAKTSLGKARLEALDEATRDVLVSLPLGAGTDEELIRQLMGSCGLISDEAARAARTRFPQGRARYSRKAMRRLIPELEAGFPLASSDASDCAIGRAGFSLAGSVTPSNADAQTAANNPASIAASTGPVRPPETTNPVVRATLQETAAIVQDLVREHGAIEVIRVETTRDLGAGAKEREGMERDNRANQRSREAARVLIEENTGNASPSRNLIRKVQLWSEQGQECIYSGRPISVPDLLSDDRTEVDHILPRSRTFGDDRMVNLVVCFTAENRQKGNRTPYEWLGAADPDRLEDILERGRHLGLSWSKRRMLAKEELDAEQELSHAHLVQTGYITNIVREWLHDATGAEVEPTRGRQTAFLRHLWGLKKDAADHRRHALDAACVALTSRSRIMALGWRFKQIEDGASRESTALPLPWEGFTDELAEKYDECNVSHRPRRGVRGALHEETVYGRANADGKRPLRRSIEQITSNKRLEEVRDPAIRAVLAEHLRASGIDPEDFKAPANRPVFSGADPPRMSSGVPIKSVRCLLSVPSAIEIGSGDGLRAVLTGNNHHATVLRGPDGRMRIEVVSTFEVYRRRRAGQPLISRDAPEGWEFAFSLMEGEVICLDHADDPGLRGIFVIVSLERSESQRRLLVLPNNASPVSTERKAAIKKLSARLLVACRPRKLLVTSTGAVRRASD